MRYMTKSDIWFTQHIVMVKLKENLASAEESARGDGMWMSDAAQLFHLTEGYWKFSVNITSLQ